MTTDITESVVEEAALSWLAGLGYTVLYGPEIGPDEPVQERARCVKDVAKFLEVTYE